VFLQVLARLQQIYGDLYTEQNVMISATHTHSTPGGYMHDLLFDLSVLGFVRQSFMALTAGIIIVSGVRLNVKETPCTLQ
jgi:neutral ceramidase